MHIKLINHYFVLIKKKIKKLIINSNLILLSSLIEGCIILLEILTLKIVGTNPSSIFNDKCGNNLQIKKSIYIPSSTI